VSGSGDAQVASLEADKRGKKPEVKKVLGSGTPMIQTSFAMFPKYGAAVAK
jgi:hypothetical protein